MILALPSTKGRKKPVKVPVKDIVAEISKEIEDLMKRLIAEDDVDVGEVFGLALRSEEFLRLWREKTAIQAAYHTPKAVDALGRVASTGDVAAVRLLLDILGMPASAGKGGPMMVTNVQVTQAPTLRDVLEEERRKKEIVYEPSDE